MCSFRYLLYLYTKLFHKFNSITRSHLAVFKQVNSLKFSGLTLLPQSLYVDCHCHCRVQLWRVITQRVTAPAECDSRCSSLQGLPWLRTMTSNESEYYITVRRFTTAWFTRNFGNFFPWFFPDFSRENFIFSRENFIFCTTLLTEICPTSPGKTIIPRITLYHCDQKRNGLV